MEKYNHEKIEKKWQAFWDKERIWEAKETKPPKFYILDMFPYPSAEGLHVGHPEGYTASDIVARCLRMKGFNVLHPMGWDAFGLPAENYAIKTGVHPKISTEKNIKNFKRQIKALGFSYDWSREINTTNPDYYKWTQWIFLQMFKKGLAYEATVPINWCPSCKTGLANEEVVGGACERCNAVVTKKNIRQWLLKITKYAERLLKGLDSLDWPEPIKLLQRNWIGRSEGASVKFSIAKSSDYIEVFTTRPDTLFGATYMVLAPEHSLVDKITTKEQKPAIEKYRKEAARKSDLERTELAKEKTGIFTGAYAVNPVNNKKIPIWVADYVLISYGTGAIMAVPGHDERDYEFAKKYKLLIIEVIKPPHTMPKTYPPVASAAAWGMKDADLESKCWTGDGTMINSGNYNGMDSVEFKKKIVEWLSSKTVQANNTCLVVHGVSGHKRENWFPWLKDELARVGWETVVPTMPGAGHPTLDSWNDYLGQYDQKINENSVLVGHSLGCASILYHLQELGKKVDTVILVAPTNPLQKWSKLKDEYPDIDWDATKNMNNAQNFNWKKIRTLAKHFIILYSDDDPYIPAESMAYYKKNLPEAEIHLIPGKSHFSESHGGIKSLPEILSFFPKRLSVSARAKAAVNYKLRDWVFSRQRYWGEPIPVVHCEKCNVIPVPEKDLPVKLPEVKNYKPTGTGESPLAHIEEWVKVKCPQCGGPAKRETNTMPQWAGSCWYYLRYLDPKNKKELVGKEKDKYWMASKGVDLYVGGAEHAVLHLLYARFWHMFLYDIGVVSTPEPFHKLKNQGIILGEDNQKMSKSRGNVINPDDVVKEFGADSMRLYEMFMGPFEAVKPWSTQGIRGVYRFLNKVWAMQEKLQEVAVFDELKRLQHKLIKKVTEDIETFNFNTAVSSLMEAVNTMAANSFVPKELFETFLILLSPFAPHFAEELWEKLGHKKSIVLEKWPAYDAKMIKEAQVELVVQVNGKLRDRIKVSTDISKQEAQDKALASAKVKKYVHGEPKKVVFVKNRLINFVV